LLLALQNARLCHINWVFGHSFGLGRLHLNIFLFFWFISEKCFLLEHPGLLFQLLGFFFIKGFYIEEYLFSWFSLLKRDTREWVGLVEVLWIIFKQ